MRYDTAWRVAGITYRQADHWRHMRYINASSNGSGNGASEISRDEAGVLLRMAALVRAGMKVPQASHYAHLSAGFPAVDLPGGLLLVFDKPETLTSAQKASTA